MRACWIRRLDRALANRLIHDRLAVMLPTRKIHVGTKPSRRMASEIWDAAAWNAYAEGHEDAFAELEEEVIPGLF